MPSGPKEARADRSADAPARPRREKGNPNRPPKEERTVQEPTVSPEEREAAKLAALEKLKEQKPKPRRIPLRGRLGVEVPAIG